MRNLKRLLILLIVVFLITNLIFAIYINAAKDDERLLKKSVLDLESYLQLYGSLDEHIDFEGFDNQVSAQQPIIPNIVHLINLNQTVVNFHQFITILSIWLNHKPNVIYIHCDKCSLKGKYWQALNSLDELKHLIKLNQIPEKNTIFNKKLGWIHHRADLLRLQVLMNYGGIYLDNDVIVVNSLNKYLYYEAVVSLIYENVIGNQVLIAHRNARILRAFSDQYR